ncbi:MAG: SLC13 family permease [Paenibacillaceae bacterium]
MASIQLFKGLTTIEQARLLGKMERMQLPQHSFVFMQNDPGDCMYVLAKGRVEVFAQSSQGNQSVGEIEEGETFGEINLLLGQPRSATVMAMTDLELYIIRQDVFDQLINEHASIANYFTRLLSNRLLKTNDALIEYKNVQQNLAMDALERLPQELRNIFLLAYDLPKPYFPYIEDYCGIESLEQKFAEQENMKQLYTIDEQHLIVNSSSLETLKQTAAAEVDSMELEHFVLTFVDLYMQNELMDEAVALLLQHQLWNEACFLINSRLVVVEDADQLKFNTDLLDICPNEVLFSTEQTKVLFFYLDAKLQVSPYQGFSRVEEMIQRNDGEISPQVKIKLYEYMIAFCDKLGFEQKALEYYQFLMSASQVAVSQQNLSTGADPEHRKRAFALAKLNYESTKNLKQLGAAHSFIRNEKWTSIWCLAFVLAALTFFYLSPPFAGLDRDGMIFIGITLSAVVLWMVNIIPDYLVSLLMCMSWVLFGLVEPPIALSGFSNAVWLYIIFALLLGAAITTSGLMYRVSLHLLRIFPKSYRGQLLGLSVAGLALNPIIPSGMTKVVLSTPISMSITESLGFHDRSKGSAGLVLSGFIFFGYATPFLLTSGLGNFLALGLVPGYHISFLAWAWYALPAFLLFSVLMIMGILYLYKPEPVKSRLSNELIHQQLGTLGRLTKSEKVLILTLVFVIVMQILQPIHQVSGVWIMLCGIAFLIINKVLDKNAIRSLVDFTVLLHLGIAIGFSKVASELGVAAWFSDSLLVGLSPFTFSPYVFLPVLILFIYILCFFIYSTPAIILLIVALLPLFQSLGIDPWILIFIVLLSADPFIVPYQSEVYLAAYYSSNEKGFTHRQGRKLAFLYCGAVIVIVFASIPFWTMIGLLG